VNKSAPIDERVLGEPETVSLAVSVVGRPTAHRVLVSRRSNSVKARIYTIGGLSPNPGGVVHRGSSSPDCSATM
jgi:hypothetical protein